MAEAKTRILIVEDDEIDREAVRRRLSEGHELLEAATGQQGVDLINQEKVDCILLDYRLPDTNGIELIETFMAQDLPVIILTGEESPATVVEAMRRGAQDYLVKNHLSSTELNRAISNAIEKTRLRRELKSKQEAIVKQARLLQEQNQKIRALASELTLAEQKERRRIAQILHDDLQQTIHGISVRRHVIYQSLPADQKLLMAAHMEALDELIEAAISSTRSLSVDLSPPTIKNIELNLTFEWLAGYMQRLHGLEVELDFRNECKIESEDLRVLLFQLVRELLFNVVKHAGTMKARLEVFELKEQLHIRVSDQGKGFDVTQMFKEIDRQGFGLYSVKERIELFDGKLEIESIFGRGTQMTILIPKEGGPTIIEEEEDVMAGPPEKNFECEPNYVD